MATVFPVTSFCRISACFFLLLMISLSASGPVKPRKKVLTCSRHCRVPKEGKFKYIAEQVYDYSYRMETAMYMSGTPQHSTKILIEAMANVHVISTCDMVLKLREVRVLESNPKAGFQLRKSDNSRRFREELEAESLRFAFLDGRISDVCPSARETVWALNVKRGFLSAFQNTMVKFVKDETVEEKDVLGSCQTVYHATGNGWFSSTIRKSRDLSSCTSHSHPSPLTGTVGSPSGSQGSRSKLLKSLLTGRQECQQTIDWNGILSSAICVEQRHFRQLEGDTTGSVTKVSQTIKFLRSRERGRFSPPINKRMSLEFDPVMQSTTDTEDRDTEEQLRRARTVLRQMCLLSEILPETTDLFYELVMSLRHLGAPSLRVLYEKVSGTSLCSDHLRVKKYFLDALAMAGTDNTVRLLAKALTSKSKKPITSQFLLTTLAFLPSTSSAMLQAVKGLLDHRPLSQAALLPVSSMVHNYCQHHTDCDTNSHVNRILLHFKRVVGTQCYGKGVHIPKVLLGLRAIGNAGQVKRMTEVLNNCLKRRNNPLEVRLTAVQAFRRMPCGAHRERAQLVFEDTAEHTELRIASYLTIMQCAELSHFVRLERALAKEPNMQVLSFVFTHLTNLKDTSDLSFRSNINTLLSNVDFASRGLGRLLLSRNFGGHTGSDSLSFDTNLIWPSSSESSSSSVPAQWLPRSLTTNLTFRILGREIDLAEVGVRGEGLEVLVEEVLFPLLGRKKPFVGPKKKQLKLGRLKGSSFLRIFGHDLAFQQVRGNEGLIQLLTSGKRFSLKQLISSLSKDGKNSYSQSLILMDQKQTMATSSGLPLTVSLHGSTSAQLQLVGKLDLKKAFAKPRSLFVGGAIKPSAALRVTSTMDVDAMVTRATLRMTGTVHSSTILKGRVQIDRGRMANMELDMPREKTTIFDVRTEISFLHNKKEYPLVLLPPEQRELTICTGPVGVRLLGLDLCGEVRLPRATTSTFVYDFLSSPSSASIFLYKKDSLSRYKLLGRHLLTKHSLTSLLSFSTPDSEVDRNLELYLNANVKQRRLELRMTSPWKQAELKCSISSTHKLKGISFSLSIDKEVTHGLTAAIKVTKDKVGFTYTPVLELRHFGMKPVMLTGTVSFERFWKKITADFVLKGISSIPPTLKGTLTNSKKELSLRGTINLGLGTDYSIACGTYVTVTGKHQPKVELIPFLYVNVDAKQIISLTGRGSYRQGRFLRADGKLMTEWTEPVSIQYTMVKTPTKRQVYYKLESKIKSSTAVVNIEASAEVRERQLLLARATLAHDIPGFLPKDTVSMVAKLAERRKSKYWSGVIHATLASKAHSQYNFDLKLNAERQPTSSLMKLYYGYGADHVAKNNYVALTSRMRHEVKHWRHVVLSISTILDIPAENVHIEMRASHKHDPQALESRASLNYGEHQQTQAGLTLVNKGTKYLIVVGKAFLRHPRSKGRVRRSRRTKHSKRMPEFQLDIKLTESENDYELKTGARAGRKKREFSSSLNVKKPVSLRRVHMHWKGNRYSRVYQDLEAEFSHTMHPLLADVIEAMIYQDWDDIDIAKPLWLLTSVDGAVVLEKDEERSKMAAQSGDSKSKLNKPKYSQWEIENLFSDFLDQTRLSYDEVINANKDIKGGIDVKSSFVDITKRSLNFAYGFEDSIHESDITFADNEDDYNVELTMKNDMSSWLRYNRGAVVVSTPRKQINTEWEHDYVGSTVRSYFLTSWNANRKIYFDMNGRLETGNETQDVAGDFVLQSPWKPVKNWRVSLGHGIAPGLFRSKSTLRLDGLVHTSHHITYMHTPEATDAGFMLLTPWTRKMSGSVMLQHDLYPMTLIAELAWSTRHRITVTGSADLAKWDDVEVTSSMKTSLPGLKGMSVVLTNKIYGQNLVSEITAKYGASKTFSVETTLRRHDFRRLRLRVLTPFEVLRILETGFQMDGDLRNMTADADFRVFPSVKKLEGSLAWIYDGDFSGKLRVDIPLKEFSYVQVLVTSELKGTYRYSSIMLKHPPSEVYEIDTKYTFQSPEELVITVKTPHELYDKMAVQVNHQRTDMFSDVSMKVSFPPDKKILAVGQVDFNTPVRGNFSLMTPFTGFETFNSWIMYENHGPELLMVGNFTTGERYAISQVRILSENADFSSIDVSSVLYNTEQMYETIDVLSSIRKLELDFHTVTSSQMAQAVSHSLADNEETRLSVICVRSPGALMTKFQFDSESVEEIRVVTNYTGSPNVVFVTLSAGYGQDYSVQGSVMVPLEKESLLRRGKSPNRTPYIDQQTSRHSSSFISDTSSTTDIYRFSGVTVSLKARAPFSQYDQFGLYTHFHRNSQEDVLLPVHSDTHDPSLDIAMQTISFHGWASHSVKNRHWIFFNASHEIYPRASSSYVDFKTALNEVNDTFFHYRSSGIVSDFSGTVHTEFKGKQILKANLDHTRTSDLFKSSIDLETDYLDGSALAVGYCETVDSTAVNASVEWGDTFDIRGRFANGFDTERKIRTSSMFGIKSSRTGKFSAAADIAFSESDPWSHFSADVESQIHDKIGSAGVTLDQLGHLGLSGKLALQTNNGDVAEEKPVIMFMYNGLPSNFNSSFYVHHFHANPVSGVVKVSYKSVFDMKTEATLKSPFHIAQDLNFALRSVSSGHGEHRAFMLVGWAPYKQISVDAASKNTPSVIGLTRHTDIFIVTPFHNLQTGLVKIRRSRILSKTNTSVLAQVNDQTLLDLDIGSDDPSSLGLRPSVLRVFQRNAYVSDRTSHHGRVFLRWSLADPARSMRVVTKYVITERGTDTEGRDFSAEVVHPWKKLLLTYLSQRAANSQSGEGSLKWDEAEEKDNSVHYSYLLLKEVTPHSRNYHGYFQLGCPVRSLEINGSWTGNGPARLHSEPRAESFQGVLNWNPDRHPEEQVMVTSMVTVGEMTSAEVAVTLPAADQTVRLKSDLTLLRNDIIWNSTTSLCYSSDSRKTVTLSSVVLGTSAPAGDVSYSMSTILMQPSSDLDVGVTSRIASSELEYASSLGGWYLTSRKTMQRVDINGVFDRLSRSLQASIRIPSKEMSMEVELPDKEPYQFKVKAILQDDRKRVKDKQLGFQMLLDPFHRSFLIRLDHDTVNPNNFLALEAWYVNDSAVRTEVYRKHVTGIVTDSALSVLLKTPTLLHLSLTWRPELQQEMKILVRKALAKMSHYKVQAKKALGQASPTIENEVRAKLESVVLEMVVEFSPLLDLLQKELDFWGWQLDAVLRDMQDLYGANEEALKSLAQAMGVVRPYVRAIAALSRHPYRNTAHLTKTLLNSIMNSTALNFYRDFPSQLIERIEAAHTHSMERLQELLYYADIYLLLVKDRLQEVSNTLSSLRSLESYGDFARTQLRSTGLLDNLHTATERARSWLSPLSHTSAFTTMASTARELYYQGSWLYGYFRFGSSIDQHVESITDSLKEILLAEIHFRLRHIRFLRESQFTVWQPERGFVQADICLPYPVQSLSAAASVPAIWTNS